MASQSSHLEGRQPPSGLMGPLLMPAVGTGLGGISAPLLMPAVGKGLGGSDTASVFTLLFSASSNFRDTSKG